MSAKPLPCPKCGSDFVIGSLAFASAGGRMVLGGQFVHCCECECSAPECDTYAQAVNEWNAMPRPAVQTSVQQP